MKRVVLGLSLGLLAVIAVLAGVVAWLNLRGESPLEADDGKFSPTAGQLAQGEYLVRAANCIACHTARGGAPFAGGRAIPTPFGTMYSSNITPDRRTGIGSWTRSEFWRALHNGRARDGRLLYPAFPYTEYTLVTREDADAMFAYLQSVAPVSQPSRPHGLRFPYNSQAALAVWRALFFEPRSFEPEPAKSAAWNRGAYLVRGPGHCIACHSARNVLGASSDVELGGGLIPAQGWYAPSLVSDKEAGLHRWSGADIVRLLKTGVTPGASTLGPMAEVVYTSTQYLSDADLAAMAEYLKDLPQPAPADRAGWLSWLSGWGQGETPALAEDTRARGAKVYEARCADCHGREGEGAPGAYPALAGNRAVVLEAPANLIRVVLAGGYPPATAGNPRPFGMPPFAPSLNDADVAAVTSYVRNAWGNTAPVVSAVEVERYRSGRVR